MTTASTARQEAGAPGTAPAEFRRRLLEGMAAAIRECGYRDSTVADVVRHARTSRRTFYEHFPGKQACFVALLREANATMVRQIAAAVDRRAPWDVQARQAIEAWIASAPREGRSRIQLSVRARSACAAAIHASMACRAWTSQGARRSTAAAIWRTMAALASRSRSTKQACLLGKCS